MSGTRGRLQGAERKPWRVAYTSDGGETYMLAPDSWPRDQAGRVVTGLELAELAEREQIVMLSWVPGPGRDPGEGG